MPGKFCVVDGCRHSNVDGSVHLFPKDPAVRRKWESFVKSTRLHWGPATGASIICGSHFKDSDFQNLNQFRMGLASRLMLKHNAVPSIKFPSTTTSAADGPCRARSTTMTMRKDRVSHTLPVPPPITGTPALPSDTFGDPSPWKTGTTLCNKHL